MSNLPNSEQDQIKVFVNEYITNTTVNRPNLRLLENDLYLENLVSGYAPSTYEALTADIINSVTTVVSADIITNTTNISTNTTNISQNTSDISTHLTPLTGFSSVRKHLSGDFTAFPTYNATTVIPFTSGGWDDNSEWDDVSSRFVFNPSTTITGKINVNCHIIVTNGFTAIESLNSKLLVYKNGVKEILLENGWNSILTPQQFQGSSTVEMASGDYIDIRFTNGNGVTSQESLLPDTYGFESFYVCIDRIK